MSFEEIDCRPLEGFIVTAEKQNKKIEELIFNTVSGYLKWFLEKNISLTMISTFKCSRSNIDKIFRRDKSKVADTVLAFNNILAKQAVSDGFKIIDIYKFTAGEYGFFMPFTWISVTLILELSQKLRSNYVIMLQKKNRLI